MARRGSRGLRRVAFITPEYVTEAKTSGGVASYVHKMATALSASGIEVEVFVPSHDATGQTESEGIRVHRIRFPRSLVARALTRALMLVFGPRGSAASELWTARRLALAFERRHREDPFDVVQSSNHQLTGAFVRRVPDRVHVTRISTSRRLYDRGTGWRTERLAGLLEAADVLALRRADRLYAPSAFLATHFRQRHGLDVAVIRPPAASSAPATQATGAALPEKYLVHYGALGSRKGTDLVAHALVEAWREAPDLHMVWIGTIAPELLARFRALWGAHDQRVSVLGRMDRTALMGVVARATASVLPSVVDNLPNTVMESLGLGVPVIGSAGASIDELVEDGVSGTLIPIGDATALAQAMVAAWRGRVPWVGDGFRAPKVLEDMRPDRAVQAFLRYVTPPDPPRP